MDIYQRQFNVDLCLDTISVLNRTIKDGKELTPYETFSNDHIDHTPWATRMMSLTTVFVVGT